MGDRDSRSRNSVPRHGVKDTAEKEKESEGGAPHPPMPMRIIRVTAKQVCRFSNFRRSVSFFLAEVTDIAMTAVQFLREIVGFTGSGGAAHIVKVHPRKNEAHDDEPAGSLSHHGKTLPCRNDLDVEQRSRRKEFTDQPDESQGKRKTDSHAQTVHRGIQHRVFRRERFGAPEHDAVHDDQRNEDSERIVKTLRISLHQKIHNRHESCNHHNIAGNADLCRPQISRRCCKAGQRSWQAPSPCR